MKTIGSHYGFRVNYVQAGISSEVHLFFFFFAGTSAIALNGDACYKDFIVIPNAQQAEPVTTDRFCGNALIQTRCKYPELFI